MTCIAFQIVPDIALTERLFDELGAKTGDSSGITRDSYGMGEQFAHDLVRMEAEKIGMECHTDAACNLYMVMRGRGDGPAIMIGSHLDSVPSGGNFDGAAGVLAGLAVASGFHRAGQRPPVDLVVTAIRAEESTWFGASYIGSRAAFGTLTDEELDGVCRSDTGIPLGAAIEQAGGDPNALRRGDRALDPARVALFVETHIEQGPVLIDERLPVGLVTGIRGSFRHRHAACFGEYAHSGATPRKTRRDAVRATAELVSILDELWARLETEGHDLSVTFGQVNTVAEEAAFSKVAGRVDFALDIRSECDTTLDMMRAELRRVVAQIELRTGTNFDLGDETGSDPARMNKAILAQMEQLADALAIPARRMASGAGHDAAVFARQGIPTAMLFIRNRNGSHNPDESMDIDDFAQAARLLCALCESWSGPPEPD
ncbi:hydantoinase/carbamoylase family amidase [Tropicimonas sp. IMCC34043]|uniref:hydantoinase/carbamoylase family amidase n=1 Tax=Tropicimonas sp. IMCC34043 TaxID=2248760 RepID=UPI000E21E27A|nr:hydantoinase/carbamoylase family amidase [Tropicimonas sp. IMCC34043]